MSKPTACSFPECDRAYYCKRLCASHYAQQHSGKPLTAIGSPKTTLQERFWAKVEKGPACWIWRGSMTHNGYGQISAHGRLTRAHRLMWEWQDGAIPEGMQVDHTCGARSCVNPAHLRLVSPKQNMEHRQGANRNSISGVLGVRKAGNGWTANVMHNRESHYGGYFADIEDAKAAVKRLRNELFTHNDRDRAA